MTLRSAAVYGSCGAVLVACLAAANMPSQDPDPVPARPARPARVAPDALAAEIQSEAARLHARIAEAPAPARALRNPFAFGGARTSREAAAASTAQATVAANALPAAPPMPELLLMGIAEETSPSGPHRTAIIGGAGDALYMVVEGDAVANRYRVTKIGADAVELEDQVTKAYRRIALR
jgi:hypothetical protein